MSSQSRSKGLPLELSLWPTVQPETSAWMNNGRLGMTQLSAHLLRHSLSQSDVAWSWLSGSIVRWPHDHDLYIIPVGTRNADAGHQEKAFLCMCVRERFSPFQVSSYWYLNQSIILRFRRGTLRRRPNQYILRVSGSSKDPVLMHALSCIDLIFFFRHISSLAKFRRRRLY